MLEASEAFASALASSYNWCMTGLRILFPEPLFKNPPAFRAAQIR